MIHLVVTQAFGHHEVGARIEDPQAVEAVRSGPNASRVVAVLAPEAPARDEARADQPTTETQRRRK